MKHLRILNALDEIVRTGSIRKAAERLAVTPSALNRRVQDLEQELGTPIFERLPRGVRLNAAGELLIRHTRSQVADFERVRSQIADLSGVRRGHVTVACSQALAYHVLPDAIAAYRAEHPLVTFDVQVRDHAAAQEALLDFSVDLALVFQPANMERFQALFVVARPIHVILSSDHPLAAAAPAPVRLRETLRYPLALPSRGYGSRQLVEDAVGRGSLRLSPIVETNSFEFLRRYVRAEHAVTFQVGLETAGPLRDEADLVTRPIDARDLPPGQLALGQLRGRALPVASAKFAERVARLFDAT